MSPDINAAKEYLLKNIGFNGKFDKYSTAYVVTNEDIRSAMKFMPKVTENALTVTGSGDHPMFMKIYGAKNIDTFDLSYNAKLIMDIKTAALPVLKHTEYYNFLKAVYFAEDLLSVENMPKIIEKLPYEEKAYIAAMRNCRLFNHGLNPDSYLGTNKPVPYLTEFQKMREVITEPFNFIWSDIASLHEKLDKTYDFMHLSNIIDYIKEPDGLKILASLMKYTHVGSVIYFETFHYCYLPEHLFMDPNHCRFMINKNQIWAYKRVRQNQGEDIHAMQRLR